MDILQNIFQRKTVNVQKLLDYGFSKKDNIYSYRTFLPDSGFEIIISITAQNKISATVIDPAFSEPYTLHLANTAAGSFVGGIKAAYEHLLNDIADRCFDPDVFKGTQTKTIINYVRNKYGDEPEYLWKKFPENAVWRRKDSGKWYGALLTVSTSKLGIVPGTMAEIIDLRGQPENISILIDKKLYFPGWHMNKKHWYTMILDGSIPFEELCQRIDASYLLAVK